MTPENSNVVREGGTLTSGLSYSIAFGGSWPDFLQFLHIQLHSLAHSPSMI